MFQNTFSLYLNSRRFVTSIKKISNSPIRCATDGVIQPRSYGDTITDKHKIQIKMTFKMYFRYFIKIIIYFLKQIYQYNYFLKKIFIKF